MEIIINNSDAFTYFLEYLSIQEKVNLHEAELGFKHKKYKIHKRYIEYCCKFCTNDNIKLIDGMCNDCIITKDTQKKYEYLSLPRINEIYDYIKKKKIYRFELIELDAPRKVVAKLFQREFVDKMIMSKYKTKLDVILYYHKKTLYYNRKLKLEKFRSQLVIN